MRLELARVLEVRGVDYLHVCGSIHAEKMYRFDRDSHYVRAGLEAWLDWDASEIIFKQPGKMESRHPLSRIDYYVLWVGREDEVLPEYEIPMEPDPEPAEPAKKKVAKKKAKKK